MPGYCSHSHQIRWVRNIYIIRVRACVVAFSSSFIPLLFLSGDSQCVKRNQSYVQFDRQTIFSITESFKHTSRCHQEICEWFALRQ